jgi:hypothetical protein
MANERLEAVAVPCSPGSGVLPTSPPLKNTLASVVELLSTLPEWAGVLATSELDQNIVFRRPPPWVAEGTRDKGHGARPAQVRDRDIARARRWLEERHGLVVAKHTMVDAVRMVADENAFHPVREYLMAMGFARRRRSEPPRAYVYVRDAASVPLSNCPTTLELTSRAEATAEPGADFDRGLSSSTSTRSQS